MAPPITRRTRVATVLTKYPESFAVFRRHGCPGMRRGLFAVMSRLISVRAARIHRIPFTELLDELNRVAIDGRSEETAAAANRAGRVRGW